MFLGKVIQVENVGRFTRLLPKGDVEFRRLNLIYGENGHGKTTIAGIIRSLQTGDSAYVNERARLGGGAPLVRFKMGGGVAAFEGGAWNLVAPDIEVFDSTFVSDNVYAGDHVEPEHKKNLYQVVVGAAAVTLARRIDEIDAEGRIVLRDAASLETRLQALIQQPFSMEDFLNLKPEAGVAERIGELTTQLNAARKSKELISRTALAALRVPTLPATALAVIKTTVDHISAEAERRIREHVRVRLDLRGEQWVRQGLEYLKQDKSCPFCTQSTEKIELVELFRKFFSTGYSEHVVAIERAATEVEQALGDQVLLGLQKAAHDNDTRINAWSDLVDLGYARAMLGRFETAARRLRDLVLQALRTKLANPSAITVVTEDLEGALREFSEAAGELVESNKAISRASAEIEAVKKDASSASVAHLEQELRRLRNVQIRQQEDAARLCEKVIEARHAKQKLDDEKVDKKAKLEGIAVSMLSLYEAAINTLLGSFGASFRITGTKPNFPGGKASSTYKISIDNKTLDLGDSKTPRGVPCFRTALSAGDKSTLALAFFIARLRNDKTLSKKTVVFDDPLSSLDDFRTSCTRSEICWIAQSAAQTVVLSHNSLFLKAIYDAHDKPSMKVVEVARNGAEFVLREWDIARYFRNDTHVAFFNLRKYLDSGVPEHADLRSVAAEIRIYLEGSFRHRFPEDFPADKWLGNFIDAVRTATATSRLATLRPKLPDLETVNEYSKQYHHAGQPGAAQPNDTELRAHVAMALAIV
jgi:wobble nucleotide-excising tRNase